MDAATYALFSTGVRPAILVDYMSVQPGALQGVLTQTAPAVAACQPGGDTYLCKPSFIPFRFTPRQGTIGSSALSPSNFSSPFFPLKEQGCEIEVRWGGVRG